MARARLLCILGFALACGDDADPAAVPSPAAPVSTPAPREPDEPADVPTPATPLGPTVDDSTTAGLMAAAGDAAPVILVVTDDAWQQVRARVDPALVAMADESVRSWLQARDVPGLAQALLATFEHELDTPAWNGRDATRPVVMSLFEPPASAPTGGSVPMMAPLTGRQLPLRSQLVIPASDRAALVASLKTWLGKGADDAPELVTGRDGAVGLHWHAKAGGGDGWVAILPEDHHVRVVVLDFAKGFSAAQLTTRIDARPTALPQTPALAHVTDATDGVGMLVRPWQLRSLSVWTGLLETMRAVATVSGDQRAMALARGTSITAVAEWLMPDDNAELDDWSFVARGDDQNLRLTTVASLTPLGRKVWGTQPPAAVAPLAVEPGALAQAYVTGDPAALIAAAPGFALDEDQASELARSYQMCGVFCPQFAMLRWPASMLATMTNVRGATSSLGSGGGVGLQLVVRSVDPPRLAVALVGASPLSASSLRGLLGAQSEFSAAEVTEAKRGADPVLLVSLGIDADRVFDLSAKPTPADALATLAIDPAVFGSLPFSMSSIKARVRVRDQAWTSELVLGPGEPSSSLAESEASWASPLAAVPPSEATRCLAEASRRLFAGLDAAALVAEGLQGKVVAKARDEAKDALDCAAADATTKPYAAALEQTHAVLAAGVLTEAHFEVDAARQLLTPVCDVGNKHGVACIRRAQLGRVGTPTLPSYERAACPEEYDAGGIALVVDDTGVLVAGRETKPGAAGLVEALVEQTPQSDRGIGRAIGVALAVDPDTPWSKMVPVVEALSAVRAPTVLAVDDATGGRGHVAMQLSWASKLTVDWKFDPTQVEADDAWLEEEPPPEPEVPGEPEEGKMGKPASSSKGGLYAMKGPRLAFATTATRSAKADVVVTVSASGMQVAEGGGKARPLADAAAFGALLDDSGRVVAVRVDDDVPWSKVSALAIAACGHHDAWRLEPKSTP